MKIGEIAKKIKRAKSLMAEYSMLDAMLKSMVDFKKKDPDEMDFDEAYYQRVIKRTETVKKELTDLFK